MSRNPWSSVQSIEWALVPPAMRDAMSALCAKSILQPPRRYANALMPSEDGVDFGHIRVGDRPAERAEIFRHLVRSAKPDQRRRHDRVAQGPTQRELRQGLAVFRRKALELVDCREIAGELFRPEQRAEQVEVAEHAASRAPVVFLKLHASVKAATQHAVSE